jgi:hypothetical protein
VGGLVDVEADPVLRAEQHVPDKVCVCVCVCMCMCMYMCVCVCVHARVKKTSQRSSAVYSDWLNELNCLNGLNE